MLFTIHIILKLRACLSNVMLWITLKNDVLKKEVNKNDIIWHYFGLGGFLSLLKVK